MSPERGLRAREARLRSLGPGLRRCNLSPVCAHCAATPAVCARTFGRLWAIFRGLLGDVWETLGRCLGDFWEIFRGLLGDVWETFGRLLGDLGRLLGDLWGTFGRSLGDFWEIIRGLLGDVWETFGRLSGWEIPTFIARNSTD